MLPFITPGQSRWHWPVMGLAGTVLGGAGSAYSAEAEALFARFTTPADTTRKGHINTLIVALKTAGVWSKLDCFYVTAAADAQAAQRNWVQDLYNLSPQNSPTFAVDRGYTPNGTSSYLDAGFNQLTAGGNFALNSATIAVWTRTDVDRNATPIGTNGPGYRTFVIPRTAGNMSYRINDEASSTVASASSVGLFAASRASSTTKRAYKNGSQLGTDAITSAGLDTSLRIGAGALTFDTREVSAAFAGGNLTTAEHLATYNALNTYMTAVGVA